MAEIIHIAQKFQTMTYYFDQSLGILNFSHIELINETHTYRYKEREVNLPEKS